MKRVINCLKRNALLRGSYNLLSEYLGVWKWRLGYAHKTAVIIPPIKISGRKNVFLYEHSHIDGHATILTTRARFIMEPGAVVSVGLTVTTGNHHHKVGRLSCSITDSEKPEGLDRDVVVGDDALISANVTLLSGVHIGRGAIIGAGAIVTKSVPPYGIAVGVPAKVVGFKFTPEEVAKHEEILYPAEKRIDMDEYRRIYSEVMKQSIINN